MDAVQTLFYIFTLFIIGFGVFQIYKLKNSAAGNTPQNWEAVKGILYDSIKQVSELYKAKQISQEAFELQVIKMIKEEIEESDSFSVNDKNFWTEEMISSLALPAIKLTIKTLNEKLK
jgi:hypothetical protein